MGKINLPEFKGIFLAAAHQERELIAISPEETAEVEPITLRFVINHEVCCCGEVEQPIVAVHGAMQLQEFVVCYMIALGPHLPHSGHSLEQREGTAHAPSSQVGKAAQHRRGIPRMSMPVGKEPAVENENA